ncbi:MAG: hypothetical protein MUF87_01535 [Anaerolineae bacterium]|jgi:hypothetical protein|nr:hypothetical protein [Anaerolineae bacterium]
MKLKNLFPIGIVLVLAVALTLISGMLAAQPAPASLSVTGITLNGCASNTFDGTYQIAVRDSAGVTLNSATAYDVSAIFTTDGGVYNTLSYPTLSTIVYSYTVAFNQPFVTGTVEFFLTNNPSIRSATYIMDCTGPTVYLSTGGTGGGNDDRLNPGRGDLLNVLYARRNTAGQNEIWVYTLNSLSQGVFAGSFPYSLFQPYLNNPPAQNTFLARVSQSTLYVLSTGEFQINVGPDAEGKVYSIIFTGLPPRSLKYASFNAFRGGQ